MMFGRAGRADAACSYTAPRRDAITHGEWRNFKMEKNGNSKLCYRCGDATPRLSILNATPDPKKECRLCDQPPLPPQFLQTA
jgi:hypothetical protein